MSGNFPWLPVGFVLNDGSKLKRVRSETDRYQFCETSGDTVCLLLNNQARLNRLIQDAAGCDFSDTNFAGRKILYASFPADAAPLCIADIPSRPGFYNGNTLCELAKAMAEHPDCSWGDSIYFPQTKRLLPLGERETDEQREKLATLLLTSGVSESRLSPKQIHNHNPWITISEISFFFQTLKIEYKNIEETKSISNENPPPDDFQLPGQPYLENFFRERIIDFHFQREQYKEMKVAPISGVLLHGQPGVGKTYSVNKLSDYLQWHFVEINLGEIGSKYIHETSTQLRRKFTEAQKKAPAIVFLDELDAMGASRDEAAHTHKIEEITELLKQVEKAASRDILVIAATNRLEVIDKALLRKGRFDSIIKLEFPNKRDIEAVLNKELLKRPHSAGLNLSDIAEQLVNRPLADVAFLINESARIAVVRGYDKINQECLDNAIEILLPKRDIDDKKYFL